jgi:hypothetical protein
MTGGTNWADLDAAFDWPEGLPDKWVQLGEVLVARTRAETEHLQLQTVVQLMIERYITTYVLIKWREESPLGDITGFATFEQSREVNKFWMSLARELNDMLYKSKAVDRDAVASEIVAKVKAAMVEGLEAACADPAERNRIKAGLVGAFERHGL